MNQALLLLLRRLLLIVLVSLLGLPAQAQR